jgi:pentatricopeptide repeat protein
MRHGWLAALAGMLLALALGPPLGPVLLRNAAALELSKALVAAEPEAAPDPARLARATGYLELLPASDPSTESLRAHVALSGEDARAAERAARLAGDDPVRGSVLSWRLGLLHLRQGREAEALAVWRDASAGPGLLGRGRDLERRGQREEALRWYRFALAVAPDSAVSYQGLASAYERAGRVEEAVRVYDQAIARMPEEETGYIMLHALLVSRSGRADLGRAILDRCLERARESSGCLFRLAVSSQVAGRLDEAAEQIGRYLRAQPESPDGWYALGQIEAARGRCASAAEAYERAARMLAPGAPTLAPPACRS